MNASLRRSEPQATARRSRLANYLALAYIALIGYASLYPFEGWRWPLGGALDFVLSPWPHYYTSTDVFLNVLSYAPLGFLVALVLPSRLSARSAAVAATLLGVALSLTMEALQSALPPRVPSNLDLLSNGLGTLVGALIAVSGVGVWLLGGRLHALRERLFWPGAFVDLGFVVVVLWLFTQLNPEIWLFGNGDIRGWLQRTPNLGYSPESYRWIETGVTAFNLAAICLFCAALTRGRQSLAPALLLLVVAALLLKSAAAQTLFKPGDAALWLTPGAMLGIPIGLVLYLVFSTFGQRPVQWGALLMLAAAVILLNAAPENPYIAASVQVWRHGHFLSFHGITHIVSTLWPFLAGAYLLWSLLEPRLRESERPMA